LALATYSTNCRRLLMAAQCMQLMPSASVALTSKPAQEHGKEDGTVLEGPALRGGTKKARHKYQKEARSTARARHEGVREDEPCHGREIRARAELKVQESSDMQETAATAECRQCAVLSERRMGSVTMSLAVEGQRPPRSRH
jgi:hypothetical protein